MAGSESFDYVIVGAGSAGCVLANRLTEDPATKVLLLEAGGEDDADEVKIPAAFASLFKTHRDWNYETVEQKHTGKPAYWPRARMLGGCSSMNAMIYIRGNRADYDGWRDRHGATGWGYDDVLPYFVKAEGNTRLGGPLHGTDGPLRVEDRVFTHELSRAWVDSAVAWGIKRTDDFNGETQDGAGLYQVTCRKGRRWSCADAYLRPAMTRPNLTVRTNAPVSSVVTEGTRAVGVSYLDSGQPVTVRAEREVLLSGGAINSPQLLMLSGIGPAEHLREHGIDVVAALPGVGQNLHDHPAAPIIWATRGTTDVADSATPAGLVRWQLTKRGPLASNIGEAGAFYSTVDGLEAPNMQVHVAPTLFYDNGLREPTVAGSPRPRRSSTWRAAAGCGCGRRTRGGNRKSIRTTTPSPRTSTRCSRRCARSSRSATPGRSRSSSTSPSCPGASTSTTTRWPSTRGRTRKRSTTRSARARWATGSRPWWTRS